jgi:hypothetical protein
MSLKRIVAQFCVAVELLTRIPMPQTLIHKSELSFAVWAYPVVGIFVGLWGGLLGSLAVFIGLPMSFAACIAILGMTLITGGLHEDGLADTVDALGGIRSVPEMLRIMKDSTLGRQDIIPRKIGGRPIEAAIPVCFKSGRVDINNPIHERLTAPATIQDMSIALPSGKAAIREPRIIRVKAIARTPLLYL